MRSSLPASKPAGIAVHSCEAQRIHSLARLSLVPQITDKVKVPVNRCRWHRRCARRNCCPGSCAEGVQWERYSWRARSPAPASFIARLYEEKKAGHTALTKGFTGRLARGIHNRLLQELNQDGTAILPYPLQRSLVRNLAIPAEAAGRSDLLPLWAGQSANLSTCTDVSVFFDLIGRRDF